MNPQRKEIILQEIKYWKKNRLLPEQYCNYLLALYSEGQQLDKSDKNSSLNKVSLGLLLIPVSLFVIYLITYFTEMSLALQITLKTFLLVGLCVLTLFSYRKNVIFNTVSLVLSLLILFFSKY